MPRAATGLLLLSLLAPPPGPAQAQTRVRLQVTASAELTAQGLRRPEVRTPGLLRDPRWREALQSSFPVRLHFRVEIWRVRPDWFDELERSFDWQVLLQFEPLTDQFSKTLIFGDSARGFSRFSTIEDLEREMEKPQQVTIAPATSGEYYFAANLQIRTLTDTEMEELERFVQGEPASRDVPGEGPSLGRMMRRLILRFGGLPWQNLDQRSERFRVRPPE